MNLTRVDMGFDRSQMTTFGLVLPGTKYNPQQRVDFQDRLLTTLRGLPGVQSVATMSGLPPLRNVNANDTDFEHIPNTPPAPGQTAGPPQNVDFFQFVSVGYTDTMGIPVVKGRSFEAGDAGGAPVVLINEASVRKFFADRDPIGARLKPGFGDTLPWFTIIGVLKDVKQGGVAEAAGTELYMLIPQYQRILNAGARAAEHRRAIVAAAGDARASVSARRPGARRRRCRSSACARWTTSSATPSPGRGSSPSCSRFSPASRWRWPRSAPTASCRISSSERKQEIGIRMALGADRRGILKLVLSRGLLLSAIGLVLGLAASFGLTRVMRTLLFNVTPTDPLTLVLVAGVMIVVATAACLVPAWRATRVDPLVVLRDT